MSSIVLAILAALTSIALMPLFKNLPQAVLAAIVINAVIGFVNISAIRQVRAIRQDSFYLALAALVGVLFLGILPGLLITVAISVVLLLTRLGRPTVSEVALLPGSDMAVALANHSDLAPRPGLLILRPDMMTLFANASWIRDAVVAQVEPAGRPIQVVALDLEASPELDISVLEAIASLQRDLALQQIELWLTNLRTSARAVLQRAAGAGLAEPDRLFDTVGQAVAAFDARAASVQEELDESERYR
jgi:MFS superfamily sulfate permease-like transporter